jgi:hypothetical protein
LAVNDDDARTNPFDELIVGSRGQATKYTSRSL